MVIINKLQITGAGEIDLPKSASNDYLIAFYMIILDILVVSKSILRANAAGIYRYLQNLVQNWCNNHCRNNYDQQSLPDLFREILCVVASNNITAHSFVMLLKSLNCGIILADFHRHPVIKSQIMPIWSGLK